MALPKSFDLKALKRRPGISFYFRYPLYRSEFREIRENNSLRGYYAAKPLYGKLTEKGKVDRSAGFNGKIAVIFISSPARSAKQAQLIFTQLLKNKSHYPMESEIGGQSAKLLSMRYVRSLGLARLGWSQTRLS
jgi:hypothetical protein